jgi:hypothetical protein
MIKESTHWYDREGQPQYTIIGKNGNKRDTNLRDAREHGFVPSVTSVMGVAAKPGLENWKIDQALLSALTLPREEDESLDDFMARAKRDANEQAKNAAKRGTDIHRDIEKGFSDGVISGAYLNTYRALLDVTDLKAGWVAEDSFCHPAGYGGKVDLYHPDGWVVDFKTKDNLRGKDPAKLVYDEHAMQLSAYAQGLEFDSPKRLSIFIDRDDSEIVLAHVWEDDSHARHLAMFNCLLMFWQLSKNYNSGEIL